jgi:hypothetical protein
MVFLSAFYYQMNFGLEHGFVDSIRKKSRWGLGPRFLPVSKQHGIREREGENMSRVEEPA